MDRIYFGHPVSVYNTSSEVAMIEAIERKFPGQEIENPNQKRHSEGYDRYKKEGKRGMDYFFGEVLPDCSLGVFMPFGDGKFGAGVWAEAKFLRANGKPVFEISLDGKIIELELDESRALSVEETRKRIYK